MNRMHLHGVLAMIGELSVTPVVECRHKAGILGPVKHLAAALHILVVAGDLARLGRLEIGETFRDAAIPAEPRSARRFRTAWPHPHARPQMQPSPAAQIDLPS